MHSILIEQATQVNAWDRIENGEKVRYVQYTYRTGHTGQCLGQNRKQRKGSLCIVYLQNRPHRSMLGTEQKTEKRFVMHSILIEQPTQVNAWDRIENREKVRYAQYTYRTAHTGQCLGPCAHRKQRKGSLCIVYLQNSPHRSMLGTVCSQKTQKRFVMHSILIEQPTQVNAWDRVLIENGEKVRYAQYTYRTGHTGQCLGPCAHRKQRKGSLCIVYLQNRPHRSMLGTEQKTEKRFVMHSILIEQATQVNAWDRVLIENREKVRYAQYTYRTAHTGQCLGPCAHRKRRKGSLCIVYLQNSPHRSMLGTMCSQKTERRFVMHSILYVHCSYYLIVRLCEKIFQQWANNAGNHIENKYNREQFFLSNYCKPGYFC